ncbi:MAG: hypothetical protein K2K27_09060 [Muribaculaceae bacterium]|nr:hypothetical protein [Muribaculaceae bacterium]
MTPKSAISLFGVSMCQWIVCRLPLLAALEQAKEFDLYPLTSQWIEVDKRSGAVYLKGRANRRAR